MDYKRMWLFLKRIVKEEADIFGGDIDYVLPKKIERFKGHAEEADYILEEMKLIEVRETLLQEKERAEKECK